MRAIPLFPLLLLACGTTPEATAPETEAPPAQPAPETHVPNTSATEAHSPASEGIDRETAAKTAREDKPGVGEVAPREAERDDEEEPADPPPPLPKDTTVLHFGDSMADALGKDLRRELRARGLKAPLEFEEATYIPQWAGYSMGVDSLLARHDPDLVIVTLGGNESAMPDPTERIEPIKRLVKKIGDRPCLWVAYPLWPDAPNTGLLEVIEENCAPCLFVDTNELVKPPMEVVGDGIHPTLDERERWAKFMIRFLRHNRDPNGERPWDFRVPLTAPPPESESWD